jgi:protein involved in polysaccharide export with SLBB domain
MNFYKEKKMLEYHLINYICTMKNPFYIFLFGITCIFFSFLSPNLISQSLDEDFLSSLPEALAGELESSTKTKQKNTDDVGRLFKADTQVDYDSKTLDELRQKLNDLSSRLNNAPDSGFINRFGEQFFNSMQATYSPINMPNFGNSYILDVGDGLNIQIESNQSIDGNFQIGRDGSISIQGLGKLVLSGLSFGEAENLIKAQAQKKLLASNVYVTLDEIRDIQIFLIGNISMPGLYTLSGGSSVLHALNVAGGINQNGSFRKIELIRNNETLQFIDLYDALIFGKNIFSSSLRSGDTIRVHPMNFLVPISGGVSTPGIYEMTEGESLSNLLSFTGGISSNAKANDVLVIKRQNSSSNNFMEISSSDFNNFTLQPRDSVVAPFFNTAIYEAKSVTVSGAVEMPGEYYINENTNLSDIIKASGGYKENAYIFGGAFFRNAAKDLQIQFNKRRYADTINEIISNIAGAGAVAGSDTAIFLEELRSQNAELKGRMIVEFDLNKSEIDQTKDTPLIHGDEIYIPSIPSHVYLFGDFREPSIVPFQPQFSLNDYVKLAAGKNSSSARHFIVIDPNGISHYVSESFLAAFGRSVDIYPGSIIYMPRQMGKIKGLQYAQAISPVLSSLAISLASLNSITNN